VFDGDGLPDAIRLLFPELPSSLRLSPGNASWLLSLSLCGRATINIAKTIATPVISQAHDLLVDDDWLSSRRRSTAHIKYSAGGHGSESRRCPP
jgi:hypothetical protein